VQPGQELACGEFVFICVWVIFGAGLGQRGGVLTNRGSGAIELGCIWGKLIPYFLIQLAAPSQTFRLPMPPVASRQPG
jgi:hypothetical protein